MMKRRHFNLIKTGRKNKLALAVGLALAMSAMGSVYASGNDDTFKNFANKDALMKTAEGFKTQEFKNSTGLEAIGANKAYALGYSGKGITVGMVDTPVYSKHSELSGDKKIQKYGYGSDDLFSIFNDRDHGTHVAGIIAANKDEKGMHGIAYDANLISLGAESSLFGEKKGFFNAYVSNAQNTKNIKIINNSWGKSTDHFDLSKDDKKENFEKEFNENAYYKNLAEITRKYDQINVYTSGNKGSIFSHAYTSGLGIFPEMKDNVLNVMAMNSRTSNLASMTCLAKNAEEWTVVAPGTGINSLDADLKYPFNNYIKKDGTSMAAPYVSGTLALIKEAFPYLSGKQIVETLLSTCNDKFLEDNYTVLLNTDGNNNLVAINLVYIDELEKQSDENNKEALEKYYNATIKNEAFFKTICDKYGIKNAEDFIRLFSKNEIGKIYYLTGKEAYGYGMVDAGKAVQGIGKIITSRLKSQDKSNIFTKESDVYLYSVDTGKKDANYKNRDYTIWSNDIGEELSADGLHAGITKKGEVDLVLLGDNTYLGPTISKDGKIQIVRGVSGNTFAIDNGIIEINGKANEVYSLNGGSTVVKDNITQKEQKPLELYGRSNADFYNSALPNTNKVDINGGLFAIGKNSITGEGSTINVNLTRSDSAIKGALYQDELGKINLSLANEAKFILQQGTGYYAGNSYKSNDTINNLNFNSFASFDMSQDGVYSTLKIGNLTGNDGQFILGTDLLNQKGDNLSINKADNSEQWISILDKNGVYVDNEDGAKKVLVATTPDNVKFKGLALAQDMGVNQYNFNPNIYYDENLKGWYFDGFKNTFEKPSSNTSWIYTTNDVINEGIHIGNDSINVKVIQKETPAMIIRSNLDDKYSVYPIVISKNKYLNFVGDGAIEVYNNLDDLNNGDKYFHVADSSAILNDGDINVHQRIILTSKNEDKNTPVGIYRSIENYGNLSFFNELEINHSVNYSHTSEAIYNLGKMDIGKKFTINISADTNINSPTGIYNGYETKKGGKYIFGEINAKDDSFITITDDLKNKSLRTATAIENKGKMIFEKDLNIILPGNTSTGPCSWDYADGIENNGIHFTYSDSPWSPTYSVDEGSYFEVKGKLSISNSKAGEAGSIFNESKSVFKAGTIVTDNLITNKGEMYVQNGIEGTEFRNIGGTLLLDGESKLGYLYNSDEGNITGDIVRSKKIFNDGNKIKLDTVYSNYIDNGDAAILNIKNIKFESIKKNSWDTDIKNYGNLIINENGDGTVKIYGDIENQKGILQLNLTNNESYISGSICGEGTNVKLSNGAQWINNRYSYIDSLGLFDNGVIELAYGKSRGNDLIVKELNGNRGIINIQIKSGDTKIYAGELKIDKNNTYGAVHTINLINKGVSSYDLNHASPFTIIEDSSEKNGGYKLNFTINPFDAGAYNYTPTLTNEKSKDNVDLWKVTDIKLTASTPDPTPDPDPDPNPNPTPDPDPNPTPTPDPDPNPNPTPDPDPNPNPTPDPNPNPNPDPDPKPDPDPTPDPNPTPAPVLSNLTYNTRANAINNYYRWRDEYNNLQKRLGDLRMSTEENGLWARTFHGKEESGKYGLNNQYNAFQIGYDKQLLQDDGGKWFVGAAVTSYDGKTNYAKQGKADNNSIGLALYGSYLGEKGHYFDVVARHSRLKSELTSYAAGTGNKITGDYHNWGSSLSMEYGRRISMKHDFYLQPEAELTYGTTSSASYSLSDGSRVKQDGISSLTARAGLTVGKEFKNSNIFASISAVHDFGDDNVFSITDKYGKTYKDISNLKDSWYELSVGGNVKFNNNTYIYADLEKTFGGDIQTKWRYNFGVRYSF